MIKTAIFDLDGTLADTIPDLSNAMNGMLRKLGYPECSRDTIVGAINHGSIYFVRHCLPAEVQNDEQTVAHAHEIYHEIYSSNYIIETKPYGNIPNLLHRLDCAGYKLAVLSNKRNVHVKEIIATLFEGGRERTAPLFHSVYGQTELPEKPDPAGALRIARECGCECSQCVFIGDSDIDMHTAVNANMYPLGVAWGYRGADILRNAGAQSIADTPDDIEKIIETLNNRSNVK